MIKEERIELLTKIIKKEKTLSFERLLELSDIPMTTLRRDIKEMERRDILQKVDGGVKLRDKKVLIEDFLELKLKIDQDEKIENSKKAISKIKFNDCVFLDAGSSVFYIAKNLDTKLNLKIVTNSIAIVSELHAKGLDNIYLVGGQFKNKTGAIVGFEALESLKHYRFDKAFIGINAIDEEGNIYTTSPEHGQIKKAIISQSNEVFGMIEKSKINKKSFYEFSNKKK